MATTTSALLCNDCEAAVTVLLTAVKGGGLTKVGLQSTIGRSSIHFQNHPSKQGPFLLHFLFLLSFFRAGGRSKEENNTRLNLLASRSVLPGPFFLFRFCSVFSREERKRLEDERKFSPPRPPHHKINY